METQKPVAKDPKRLSRRTIVVSTATLVVMGVAVALLWQPLTALMSDPEQLKQQVQAAGIWGPLVFIAFQFLQVVVAPIPGQAVGVLAGALFGVFWGTLYTMIGAFLGFTAIFYVSRKLGRPFVERFVSTEHLEKFDYLTKRSGPFVFFLIFLLPAFPDDIICYIAGLSAIPIRTLVGVSLAGRFPGYLVLALVGAGMAAADAKLVIGVVSLLVLVAALGVWQRKRIEQWVKRIGMGVK